MCLLSGGKAALAWLSPPTPFNVKFKETVELFVYPYLTCLHSMLQSGLYIYILRQRFRCHVDCKAAQRRCICSHGGTGIFLYNFHIVSFYPSRHSPTLISIGLIVVAIIITAKRKKNPLRFRVYVCLS